MADVYFQDRVIDVPQFHLDDIPRIVGIGHEKRTVHVEHDVVRLVIDGKPSSKGDTVLSLVIRWVDPLGHEIPCFFRVPRVVDNFHLLGGIVSKKICRILGFVRFFVVPVDLDGEAALCDVFVQFRQRLRHLKK